MSPSSQRVAGLSFPQLVHFIVVIPPVNDNLEAAAQAIYKKMFVDDVDSANLPDGWKIIALENVAELSAGGDRPAVYSDYPTDVCNVPIFSNGIDKEGLYGFI